MAEAAGSAKDGGAVTESRSGADAELLKMAAWLEDFSERFRQMDACAWYNAPKPRWWHRCRAADSGRVDGSFVERCACGGIRLHGDGPWMERNSR